MGIGTFLLQQHQDEYLELSYCHPETCNTLRQCTVVRFEMGIRYAFVLHGRSGSVEANDETDCGDKMCVRDEHLGREGGGSKPW